MTQQLPLSSAWQSLGTGPLLVQVVSGVVLIVPSSTIPPANSTTGTLVTAAVGTTGTQFNTADEYWAKAVATGSVLNVSSPAQSSNSGDISDDSGEPLSELLLLEEMVASLSALGKPAQDGSDVQGASMPTGGAGIRGWLSAGYIKLTAIAAALAGTVKTAPQSNAPRVTGSGALAALGAVVTLAVDGMSTAVAQISGAAWVGTVSWFGSVDGGASYFPIYLTPFVGGTSVASVTSNGQWDVSAASFTHIQAQMTSWTSGTANVLLAASNGTKFARVKAPTSDPLPIEAASLPLPAGAARDGTDATGVNAPAGASGIRGWLSGIYAAIQASRVETVWTDDSGAFYIRVDTGTSISWVNLSGAASLAPGTGARPAAGASITVDRSSYQATTAGAGFNEGDLLDHIVAVDPTSGAVVGSFWLDLTQSTKLASAPAANAIAPVSPLPTGAATDASVQAGTAAVTSGVGTPADAAVTSPAAAGSLVALAKGLLTKLGAVVLAGSTAIIGKVGIDQTTPGTTNGIVLNSAADGAIVTIGAKTDSFITNQNTAGSLVAFTKGSVAQLGAILSALAGTLKTAPQANAPRVSTTAIISSASGFCALAVDGMATGIVQLTGTWVGTFQFEASVDNGATYFQILVTPVGGTGGPAVSSVTATGQWEFSVAGYTNVQAVATTWTSGAATLLLAASSGPKIARVKAPASDPLPILVADGGDATLGSKADVAATTVSSAGSVVAWLRGIFNAVTLATTPRIYTDRSGTTSATASTFTSPLAANASRVYARVTLPPNAGGQLYVYDKTGGTPTAANSITLNPGGVYERDTNVPGGAIQVAGSVASLAFEACEGQ